MSLLLALVLAATTACSATGEPRSELEEQVAAPSAPPPTLDGSASISSEPAPATAASVAELPPEDAAATQPPTTPSATSSAERVPTAAELADAASIAALRKRALGVLTAIKKGSANGAASFSLPKERAIVAKYVAQTLKDKHLSRYQAYQAWSGELMEVRVENDEGRVLYGKDQHLLNYLEFTKVKGTWWFHDMRLTSLTRWSQWGTVR